MKWWQTPKENCHLNVKDTEGVQWAYSAYAKRTPSARRFMVTRVQQKRLTSLIYWVKDKCTLEEPAEFSNTHNEVTLRVETEAEHKIELWRKEEKSKVEAIMMENFQVNIESALQWESWKIELNSHLDMIMDTNDISLSYVIQEYTIPDHSGQATW